MISKTYANIIPLILLFFLATPRLMAQESIAPIIRGLPGDSTAEAMKAMVLESHENAKCTIHEIYEAFSELMEKYEGVGLDSAWNAHPAFALWMGKTRYNPSFYEEVGERIRTLHDWLHHHQITYRLRLGAFSYCEMTHSTAYTSQLSRQKVINLCPYWLICRPNQQASTIIHELVHKMGFGHPEGTTFPSKAIVLARTKPFKAIRSPENYEGLAESFFCTSESHTP